MKSSVICIGYFTAMMLVVGVGSASAVSQDPVFIRLSARHFNDSVASLEQAAGGHDQLVSRLLELRHSESQPQVAVRAEKLLLEMANEEGGSGPISSALAADVSNPNYAGLARMIVVHLDSLDSEEQKADLAAKAVSAHRSNDKMRPYLKLLSNSPTARVRAAAKTVE